MTIVFGFRRLCHGSRFHGQGSPPELTRLEKEAVARICHGSTIPLQSCTARAADTMFFFSLVYASEGGPVPLRLKVTRAGSSYRITRKAS